MNTDDNPQDNSSDNLQAQTYNALEVSNQDEPKEPNQSLGNLIDTMNSVDTESEEAQLNATSMDDNNGGRIEFNEEGYKPEESVVRGI